MYGIFHIRSVSVGLDCQIWYLFIYITGYLNVRKISETMDFRTLVGPLPNDKYLHVEVNHEFSCLSGRQVTVFRSHVQAGLFQSS